ncbi:MAG: hypothetical protein U9R44_02550 [Candidatus Omnitrophota bacterium]|nr:hypothetical protein [Candidatus Omnitrophota bacterium]
MRRISARAAFLKTIALTALLAACWHCAGSAFEYNSLGRRDLFVPLVGVPKEGSGGGVMGILTIDDVALQGITVSSGGEKYVVINGELLREGDKAGRLSIIAIEPNVVTIEIDDRKFEKKLYE